jgi:hypothetical protein
MIKAVDHERHNLKSSLLWQGCIEIFQCLSGPAATRAKSICRRKSRMVGKPEAIRAANWSAIVSTGDKSLSLKYLPIAEMGRTDGANLRYRCFR